MAVAVKTEKLTKTYRLLMQKEPVNAVSSLDVEIMEGEIFGFLGPNGAGKTSTIKMLLGLIYPTSGKAWIFDKPTGDIETKKIVSYLPETPYFYDYMTGAEVLDFYGRLFGIPDSSRKSKVENLLKTVGLYGDRNKRLNEYSRGMLQRIGIAQALINDPKLLILDEPTSGLDPLAHSDIRDLILRLRDEGKTVFLCSHQLSDVEMVCDRVAILNRGKLLRVGHLDELLAAGYVEIRASGVDDATVNKLKEFAINVRVTDGTCVIEQKADDNLNKSVDLIRACNGSLLSITPQRITLEELFVEMIREVNK